MITNVFTRFYFTLMRFVHIMSAICPENIEYSIQYMSISFFFLLITKLLYPEYCVCGWVYCFHVVRPFVRNVLFP